MEEPLTIEVTEEIPILGPTFKDEVEAVTVRVGEDFDWILPEIEDPPGDLMDAIIVKFEGISDFISFDETTRQFLIEGEELTS